LEAAERIRADRFRDVRTKIADGLDSLRRGEGLAGEEIFRELEAGLPPIRWKNVGDEPVSVFTSGMPGSD
jgi:hypothetical protein